MGVIWKNRQNKRFYLKIVRNKASQSGLGDLGGKGLEASKRREKASKNIGGLAKEQYQPRELP